MSFQRIGKFFPVLDQRFKECLSDIEDSVFNCINVFHGKGKRIRPAMVYLAALACNNKVSNQCHEFALVTELIHNASLFHDDVLDNAEKRRGSVSPNRLLGNDNAVLIGDLLYIKAIKLIEKHDLYPRQIVTETVLQMIQAEVKQGMNRYVIADEKVYFSIIEGKTAALISLAGFLGALESENTDWINALKTYGNHLGIAYQITDDLLDWTGSHTGKDRFSDIREGRITLPFILLLKTMSDAEKKKCIETICSSQKRFDSEIAQHYCSLMYERGVFDSVQDYVQQFISSAVSSVKVLPETVYRDDLQSVAIHMAGQKIES